MKVLTKMSKAERQKREAAYNLCFLFEERAELNYVPNALMNGDSDLPSIESIFAVASLCTLKSHPLHGIDPRYLASCFRTTYAFDGVEFVKDPYNFGATVKELIESGDYDLSADDRNE